MDTINQSLTTAGLMQPSASPSGRPVIVDGTASEVDSPVAIRNMRFAPAANDLVGPSLDEETNRPGEFLSRSLPTPPERACTRSMFRRAMPMRRMRQCRSS